MVERIGILVVHGIGEQKECEHRDAVARSLVQAWQKQHGRSNVIQLGKPPVKSGEPVKVVIRKGANAGTMVKVDIREVYWGDADENPQSSGQRFGHSLGFWRWGLSQWAVKRYSRSALTGAKGMCEPVPPRESFIPVWVRVKLFGVGIAFALLGVTWELLRFLLRRLRVVVAGSSVLARYLGDVALYTEDEYRFRPEAVKLTDAPRDAIRRRMVRGLVEMACGEYTRWYVVAHSLGSVVAYNGLMELQEALPNYLDQSDWTGIAARRPRLRSKGDDVSCWSMKPPRPCWLDGEDAIDRGELFKGLTGFFTYGSPLDKFATLWPAIVPINKDPEPLENCKWINVHDRMDPVAGSLDRFGQCPGIEPCNVAYKSSCLFILAHIRYLDNRSRHEGLAERLAEWITEGVWCEGDSRRFGGGFGRKLVRWLYWFVLSTLALLPLALLLSTGCENCVGSAPRLLVKVMDVVAEWVGPFKREVLAASCVLAGAILLSLAATSWQYARKRRRDYNEKRSSNNNEDEADQSRAF